MALLLVRLAAFYALCLHDWPWCTLQPVCFLVSRGLDPNHSMARHTATRPLCKSTDTSDGVDMHSTDNMAPFHAMRCTLFGWHAMVPDMQATCILLHLTMPSCLCHTILPIAVLQFLAQGVSSLCCRGITGLCFLSAYDTTTFAVLSA